MELEPGAPELTLGPRIRRLIDSALEEDAVGADPSAAVFSNGEISNARLVAEEAVVVAGQSLFEAVFDTVDGDIEYRNRVEDGSRCDAGDVVGELWGPTGSILQGERTALNFLQRLSGIARATSRYVDALEGSETRVTDTRKTLPGFRELDKYAVRCGGGANHRFNLSGGVIVKDNHIAAAGGVGTAVRAARKAAPHLLRIQVEVEDLETLGAALDAGADAIMLDNMSTQQMEGAVEHTRTRAGDRVLIEASGNITLGRIPDLVDLGLDFVSVGALTHSVDAADLSLQFDADA